MDTLNISLVIHFVLASPFCYAFRIKIWTLARP
jgi:hypothetical protein